MPRILCSLLLLCASFLNGALAEGRSPQTVAVEAQQFREYLGPYLQVHEDPSATLPLESVLGILERGEFRWPARQTLQFGYGRAAIWLTTPVRNPMPSPVTTHLEVRYAPLDHIDVYLVRGASPPNSMQIESHIVLGDHQPYFARPLRSRHHVAPLTLAPQTDYHLLVRLQSDSSLSAPMYLASLDALYENDHLQQIGIGLFYGVAIGLFIYNLFLFLLIRDLVYLQYILYVLGYTLFMASLDGLLYPLWPEATDWESRSIYIFPWLCGVFLAQFCRNVLQTRGNAPLADAVLRAFFWIYLVGCCAFFVMDIGLTARINSPVVALNALSILAITVARFRQGHPAAAYFMVGMGSFCFGLLAVAGGAMNLIGNYDIAPSILKMGAAIEMTLFSIALAQRINTLEALNRVSQREIELTRAEAEARQRFSRQMQEVNRHLQLAVKAKSDFLANMSHEIRTPMNGVLGMVELAQSTPLSAEQKHYLDVAYRSGQTLLALINDILDLSKIESGKLELDIVHFNLGELLADLRNLFAVTLQDKTLYFRVDKDAEVPDWIQGDRTRVWQILTNLIGNAIKFTHQGGITLTVRLISPDQLMISVRDTGIGISPDAQEKIFQSFTQADSSTTRKYGGTGLGLTISRRLAELMHGTLQVQSTAGQGSEFVFTLPFQAGNPAAAAGATESNPGQAGGLLTRHDGPPLQILLAEDNEVNQMVARGMFRKMGVEPEIVDNGAMAVTRCNEVRFDLIFMDIQMPVLDGLSATRLIQTESNHNRVTPIIAMTADSMEGDREKCLAAGMQDYLAKPIQTKALQAMTLKWAPGPTRAT